MTGGNEEFRAGEGVVDRGGVAGVLAGLTVDCLGVVCRARHLDLQTGEDFVSECWATSQGKSLEPRAGWNLGNWAIGQLGNWGRGDP